jgi:4-hydroxybenzoate polyprenyltransferase
MSRYWRERFTPARFVPAAVLVAMAATATSGGGGRDWAIRSGLALFLIAQFRIWDDLADRERDRHAHPHRVLVAARAIWPFVAQAIVLAAINIALLSALEGVAAARRLLAVNGAAAAYYFLRAPRRTIGSDLVLLAKYPAFVLLLCGTDPRPGRLVLALALTYAAACAFEVWHDASGPLATTKTTRTTRTTHP